MSEKEIKSVHAGHRERVKQKFLENELDGFADHEILELLLFYSIPRHNTNPTGHELMNKYHNISRVFDAKFDDLIEVEGINKHSATLIKLIPALCRKYILDRQSIKLTHLSDLDTILNYTKSLFIGKTHEELYLISMDKTQKVLGYEKIGVGSLDTVPVNLRTVANAVVKANASRVILAHNHPQGISLPSKADIEATNKIKQLLESMYITLDDHIIVSSNDASSMNIMGMIR